MKRILSALLITAALVAMLASCTGTTPDEVETSTIPTLEELDWSLPVEGSVNTTYTLADAQKHELSKVYSSVWVSDDPDQQLNGIKYRERSYIMGGILFSEFLADVGAESASKVTYYGHDIYGAEVVGTMTPEDMASADVLLTWIMNKTNALRDSETFVGIVCSGTYSSDFLCCLSVDKVVIE